MKRQYIEGNEATEKFEAVMKKSFKAPKQPKHVPKKRKKGKDQATFRWPRSPLGLMHGVGYLASELLVGKAA
jgi:hypothetical protein